MRVWIDQDLCTGDGLCLDHCPDVFVQLEEPLARKLWQGLAQLCVGLTHLQRGNRVGAARLMRRGAGRLSGRQRAYGIDVPRLVSDALQLAEQVETGADLGWLEI